MPDDRVELFCLECAQLLVCLQAFSMHMTAALVLGRTKV